MARIKSIKRCNHARDVVTYGERTGWKFRHTGKHIVGNHPDYPGCVAMPNRELSPGVKRQLVKAFLSIGLATMLFLVAHYYFV